MRRCVTIVAHDVGPIGGMERQLTELIRGLLGRGYAVTVVARRCDLPPHSALRWIRVPGPYRPFALAYPLFFILGTWQVWRHRRGILQTTGAIVGNRADVCTIHYCHRASYRRAQLAGHSSGVQRRINRRLSRVMALIAERWLYRAAMTRQFVAVSNGVAEEMRRCFPRISGRVTVIPNAVDQRVFMPDPDGRQLVRARCRVSASDFVAVFVGGDWELKGLGVAIRAVAEHDSCHLLVVGSGDLEPFRRMAQELGCVHRIHFVGPQKDTARFYAAADVFVLPTLYETFSLVTYEAAASALPLLVSRVSGVEDILVDGENGWFIPQDSRVIASRLHTLQADRTLRQRMGVRSREVVEPYTWSRVVDDYDDLYRLLARNSKSSIVAMSPPTARRTMEMK